VRSALPISRAWKLCPEGVYVRPRMKRYVEVSHQVMDVFRRYTDLVEPLSIDEAFLDITGSTALLGAPDKIAHSIKQEIRETTGRSLRVGSRNRAEPKRHSKKIPMTASYFSARSSNSRTTSPSACAKTTIVRVK